jgi:hypothetical protein
MAEEQEQSQENPLQRVVDKVKTISLVNNAHNLTPPQRQDDRSTDIMVIEALQSKPRIKEIILQVKGEVLGSNGKPIRIRKPIMNDEGAAKFMFELINISSETEYATYGEEEIGPRVILYMDQIYPRFTLWHKDYDLDSRDFDYVYTTLLSFIDSCFHKAKNGHFARILTKTYSEDLLGKAVRDKEEKTKQTFLQKMGVT